MMNIKKSLFICFILIASSFIFALDFNVELFSFEKPVLTVQQSVSINAYPDSTNKYYGINTLFNYDMNELQSDIGIRFEEKKFDFETSAVYAPLFFDFINFGVSFIYHFYNYSNRFYENDILPGLYLKYHRTDFYTWTWGSYYHGKYTVIPSIRKAKPYLNTNTIGFYMDFAWNFDFCKLHFDIKTNDKYDYPIFFSPFVELGVEKNVRGPIVAGLNLKSEWIDVFTIVSNPTTFTFEFLVKAVF